MSVLIAFQAIMSKTKASHAITAKAQNDGVSTESAKFLRETMLLILPGFYLQIVFARV